jgi:hypothetical protein
LTLDSASIFEGTKQCNNRCARTQCTQTITQHSPCACRLHAFFPVHTTVPAFGVWGIGDILLCTSSPERRGAHFSCEERLAEGALPICPVAHGICFCWHVDCLFRACGRSVRASMGCMFFRRHPWAVSGPWAVSRLWAGSMGCMFFRRHPWAVSRLWAGSMGCVLFLSGLWAGCGAFLGLPCAVIFASVPLNHQ